MEALVDDAGQPGTPSIQSDTSSVASRRSARPNALDKSNRRPCIGLSQCARIQRGADEML